MRLPLDQNFPEPILAALQTWMGDIQLMSLRTIDPRLAARNRNDDPEALYDTLKVSDDEMEPPFSDPRARCLRECFAAWWSDLEFGPYPDADPESNDEGAHDALDGGPRGEHEHDACVPR